MFEPMFSTNFVIPSELTLFYAMFRVAFGLYLGYMLFSKICDKYPRNNRINRIMVMMLGMCVIDMLSGFHTILSGTYIVTFMNGSGMNLLILISNILIRLMIVFWARHCFAHDDRHNNEPIKPDIIERWLGL